MEQMNFGDGELLSTPWLPPYGAELGSDQNYLVRVMLEPIMEETSDDDETANQELWSQYEHAWSSESDTGSVIRVELNQDQQDTISERDYACPAKRRRHDELQLLHNEEIIQIPKLPSSQLNGTKNEIEFKFRVDCVDGGNVDSFGKRFRMEENNEIYSDSDSISFNSLSRSSSLIQFESLERQMQIGDSQSFGGSTPSLYLPPSTNYELMEINKSDSLKRYENTESKLARNYYDIDKIDFSNSLFLNGQQTNERQSTESQSSSSENSIFSGSRESDLDETVVLRMNKVHDIQPIDVVQKRVNSTTNYRCINSVENLSEDSGYCEYNSLKKRSKSISNFNQNHEHYIEEEEEFENHKSLENMTYVPCIKTYTKLNDEMEHCDDVDDFTIQNGNYKNLKFTKIDSTKRYSAPTAYSSQRNDAKNTIIEKNCRNHNNRKASPPSSSYSSLSTQNIFSASLPDILDHIGTARRNFVKKSSKSKKNKQFFDDFICENKLPIIVSSVPNDLNICSVGSEEDTGGGGSVESDESDDSWSKPSPINSFCGSRKRLRTSVANQNVDLCNFDNISNSYEIIQIESLRQQKVINASYNNLTVLDYSGRQSQPFGITFRKMADNRKRNSGEFSKSNFLLDEISSNFDRDVSILTDQKPNYDPVEKLIQSEKLVQTEKFIQNEKLIAEPPKPPPRKHFPIPPPLSITSSERSTTAANKQNIYANLEIPHRSSNQSSPSPTRYTFDRDPTNLVTSYTESLERCNFDLHASSANSINQENLKIDLLKATANHSTPIKRKLVASTPNLCLYQSDESDDYMHVSSTHASLNLLPPKLQKEEKRHGILSLGSRHSLGKGVSFCPIVSEISWKVNLSDDEYTEEEDEDDEDDDRDDDDDISAADDDEDIDDDKAHNNHYDDDYESTSMLSEKDNRIIRSSIIKRDIQANQQQRPYVNNYQQSTATTTTTLPNLIGDRSNVVSSITTIVDGNIPLKYNSNVSVGHINMLMINESDNLNGGGSGENKNFQNSNNKNNNNFMMETTSASNIGANSTNYGGKVKSDITHPQTIVVAQHHPTIDLVKPEKKHKGFLSRFTGFRFSLRSKKNKSKNFIESNKNAPIISEIVLNKNGEPQLLHSKNIEPYQPQKPQPQQQQSQRNSVNKTSDFVYIPLKEPYGNNNKTTSSTAAAAAASAAFIAEQQQSGSKYVKEQNKNNNHVLTTKPPLPRQPPRVVGVCAKPQSLNGRIVDRPAHAQRASSAPREIDVNDHGYRRHLDPDDEDFYNQFRSEMMKNGSGAGHCSSGGGGTGDDVYNNDDTFVEDHKIGLIETNLDTHETVISGKTRSLMELGPQLGCQRTQSSAHHRIAAAIEPRRPHKSMEFLLDKENQKNILPPENELQKLHDNNTALSEHQLRVQASLQRLNIPDWYRQYSSTQTGKQPGESGAYVPGSFTKKRNSDVGRWTGLNSKTTSLSSLGSHRGSDRSPLLLSPSAHSHHGQTGFSRWSTSHLNSSQTSPSASTRGSFSRGGVLNASTMSGTPIIRHNNVQNNVRNSFRQPYMGWRSQEKLSQPRTPAERLASSLLTRQQQQTKHQTEPAVTPEIQSSIKEVTSAIVHYVNDQTNRTSNSRSRSTSPTARKCWLESSFVGNRPLDSPQTPIIDNNSLFSPRGSSDNTATTRVNGVATPIPVLSVHQTDRPSPSSTTLEDVLASLLGLPTDSYRSSEITTANDSHENAGNLLQIEINTSRRRSEGDAQQQKQRVCGESGQLPSSNQRRVSLDSCESKNDLELNIKCRYPKCDSTTSPAEAKKNYKSCHNCSHLYCSRECRRSHWEKHRKACLHSRVSALCRQVLSACKDDADALRHLSLLARKGYVSQGRGVVRILFRSPENAEVFVKQGFQCIGEASYVRWPELMPQEMGPELYSELLRLSTEYKTDSKMLIYVAICVVSETPGNGAAPVKWERQLVSRCAKLKLSKLILNEVSQPTNAQQQHNEQNTDILILTFCTVKKNTQKCRELIMVNIQNILKRRGVNLRKHFPEVFQRLSTFAEGTTDRFLPVTIHPRDTVTGRAFICIIMPNSGESDKIKLPETNNGSSVQIIDCLESVEWN